MGSRTNITFSADPQLIERARRRAQLENSTLNDKFRDWLDRYASRRPTTQEHDRLLKRLAYAVPGRKFTRDEMNQR